MPQFDYDAELRLHNEHFQAAINPRADAHVLDVGCGTGLTTRETARKAYAGTVLGVDTSAQALDQARRLSEGLENVSYLQANAETFAFQETHFDLCISRFGTMFFDDAKAAFANIARALRPSAQLVLLVWQSREHNEWSTVVREAFGAPPAPSAGLGAFSLGDPAVTEDILKTTGFDDIDFADVHEPVYYGPDVDSARDAVLQLLEPQGLLAALSPDEAKKADERLRQVLAARLKEDGVYFDSRAWLVTARRI